LPNISLPLIVGLLRKFASVIAKNICASGFETSPASLADMPEPRFKSSAMNNQKYNAATVKIMPTATNGIGQRRFAADLADFLTVFGFNPCPQLAQKAASLAEVAPHEAQT
jgi:hypothetical protein